MFAVCKVCGYFRVYGCWNMGMVTVWVMVLSICLSFLFIILKIVSTLPCFDYRRLCNIFSQCTEEHWDSEYRCHELGRLGHILHSPVVTLLLLLLSYDEGYHSLWLRHKEWDKYFEMDSKRRIITRKKVKHKWWGTKAYDEKDPTKAVNDYIQGLWFGIGRKEQGKANNKEAWRKANLKTRVKMKRQCQQLCRGRDKENNCGEESRIEKISPIIGQGQEWGKDDKNLGTMDPGTCQYWGI